MKNDNSQPSKYAVFGVIAFGSSIFCGLMYMLFDVLHDFFILGPQRLLTRNQYFNERFASLPEVQQMFDFPQLGPNDKMPSGAWSELIDNGRNSSTPQSFLHVTVELLLQSIETQRVMKTEIQDLRQQLNSHSESKQSAPFHVGTFEVVVCLLVLFIMLFLALLLLVLLEDTNKPKPPNPTKVTVGVTITNPVSAATPK